MWTAAWEFENFWAAWNLKRLTLKIITTFQGLLLKTWLCLMQGCHVLWRDWGHLKLCQAMSLVKRQREALVPKQYIRVVGRYYFYFFVQYCFQTQAKAAPALCPVLTEPTLFLLLKGSSIQSTKGLSQPDPEHLPPSRPSSEYTRPLNSCPNGPKSTSTSCAGLFP